MRFGALPSLKLTANALKIGRIAPKETRKYSNYIHFQGRLLLVLWRVLGWFFLFEALRHDGNSLEELSAEQDNLRDSLNELKQSCKRCFFCVRKKNLGEILRGHTKKGLFQLMFQFREMDYEMDDRKTLFGQVIAVLSDEKRAPGCLGDDISCPVMWGSFHKPL